MRNDVSGSQALGVIKGISARWDRKELFVSLVRDIVDARLTTGLLSAKLKLSLVDATSPTFTPAKSENQTDVVRSVLHAALGTRLIDQEKAA